MVGLSADVIESEDTRGTRPRSSATRRGLFSPPASSPRWHSDLALGPPPTRGLGPKRPKAPLVSAPPGHKHPGGAYVPSAEPTRRIPGVLAPSPLTERAAPAPPATRHPPHATRKT